jgi:hypothetical protein
MCRRIGILTLGWALGSLAGAQDPERQRAQAADQAAMELLVRPLIGVWGPPEDTAENRSPRLAFEWAIPGQVARFTEWRLVDGNPTQVGEGLLGYHYGLQRVAFLCFQRDGIEGVREATQQSVLEPAADGAIVRRLRAYDPDTSSREYREVFRLPTPDRMEHAIEYLDYGGAWKSWGTFSLARKPALYPERLRGGRGPDTKQPPRP